MKLDKFAFAALVAAAGIALAIGSATPGLAKGKKKAAPPPPQPWCMFTEQPVCAIKNGAKVTYGNWCFANNDQAKVISQKACGAGKSKKKM